MAGNTREVRAPRGPEISAKSWLTEAPLRMLMNNLDAEVAERPEDLVVYGGIGRAARDWACFDRIVDSLRALEAEGGFTLADKCAYVAGHSLGEHGHEYAVHAYERAPEMNLPQGLVHPPAGDLGKPVVYAGEQGKDGTRRHHVMEMSDDIVGVMEVDIRRGQAQGQTGETAQAEHGYEAQGEQHGGRESNRPPPER